MVVKQDVGRERVNWEFGVGNKQTIYIYKNIYTGWINSEVLLEHRELYTTSCDKP